MKTIYKRLIIYVIGLFTLALGCSFSIMAHLGVSPVSSLAYSIHLISPWSVGLASVVVYMAFIAIQMILNRCVDLREACLQMILSVIFGFFMDATLWLLAFLPAAQHWWLQAAYLIISLWVISCGLVGYFTAKLPLLPYDALSFAIKNRFDIPFSRAKISGDVINVLISASLCWTFLHQWGAIGIGTAIAAVSIGKIMGFLNPKLQPVLLNWLHAHTQQQNAH